MNLTLTKKTFVNLYFKIEDYNGNTSVSCQPLGEINPDTFEASKVTAITEALSNILQSSATENYPAAQIIAVKKVEGYVFQDESSKAQNLEAITPYIFDLDYGEIEDDYSYSTWKPESSSKCYTDVYKVQEGTKYFLTLGQNIGSCFRVMFSTVDVSKATEQINGTAVNEYNYDNIKPYQHLDFAPKADGYLVIQKDYSGVSGIKTYLYTVSKKVTTTYDVDS